MWGRVCACVGACVYVGAYECVHVKTYNHNGSEEDYAIYKEALNQATAEIRNSKRSYEQKIAFIIKHDSKSFMRMFQVNRKFRIRSGH